MAVLSVSNTFVSNTTAFASEVNQNFSDIITWANGNISNSNFTTMTGEIEWSVSSNVFAIDIANSGTEGSINVAQSGVLASNKSAVKILASGTQNTGAAALDVSFTGSATIPLVKLTNSGTGPILKAGSAVADLFEINSAGVLEHGGANSPLWLNNLALSASVGSSALTLALKGYDGNDHSSSNPGFISFRSATLTSGTPVVRRISAATSLVISSGSTLGTINATACDIYVYALDNAGTVELALSMKLFDDGERISTTAEGGAGAADTSTVAYSTTARTNVACRLIGRLTSNQTTAGTWASVPTEITLVPFKERRPYAIYNNANTSTTLSPTIVNFETSLKDPYSRVTTGSSWKYVVDRPGVYSIASTLLFDSNTPGAGSALIAAVYKNGAEAFLGQRLIAPSGTHSFGLSVAGDTYCVPGDELNITAVHDGGGCQNSPATSCQVSIRYVGEN
jgi:hypothetical protein